MAEKKKQTQAPAPKEVTEEKVIAPKEPEKKVNEPKMYVGPTIAKLGLIQNVVYTGIPASASAAITDNPMIGNLFIRVADYPKAERSIRERTGLYWLAYNEVQNVR